MRVIGVASYCVHPRDELRDFRIRPACTRRQAIFRFDTFGDEQLWTDVLRMHEAVAKVDPATALSVGLKVDVDALPADVVARFDVVKSISPILPSPLRCCVSMPSSA
jgi:hypothetical protein